MSDAEIIEAIATKVMGFDVCKWPEHKGRILVSGGCSTWNPLTNPADCKQVREKLADQGWFYRLYGSAGGARHITKTFRLWGVDGQDHSAEADTEERAVCLAALKSVGVEP